MKKAEQNSKAPAGSRARGAAEVRIGPAGWSYTDWAGYVYPSRRPKGFHEATYLAQFFDTIEINTSFYGPMRADHAKLWLERVSANPRFLFTAKLWQKFTHDPVSTREDERLVREGFDVLRGAGKLGAVLAQFPFSFHRSAENMVGLTVLLQRFADYPLAVELRHASWNAPEVFALLREHGVALCNLDQPIIGRSIEPRDSPIGAAGAPTSASASAADAIEDFDPRLPAEAKTSPVKFAVAPLGYIRLHGRRYDTWFSDDPEMPAFERYNYLYSTEELAPWATRIRTESKHAQKVFAVTNNHYLGKGVVNALQLLSMLKGAKVNVPDPLRVKYPELEKIADLPPERPTLFPMD
ncbi:MAG TPA: DUF72 domain-containing protein [Candidatus Sulfotelmatobacter sp.]|nr:DUF72 domain-containing protein [Candidatus Sulfotelmatobacter sp.]